MQSGSFAAPLLLAAGGEPYDERAARKAAQFKEYGRGVRQFQTSPSKQGQSHRTLSPFLRLFEGEPYVDRAKQLRLERLESRKRFIADKPFRLPSPPKLSASPGDYHGSFSLPHVHLDDGRHEPRVPRSKHSTFEPRQIQTCPPRSGSYGSVGTLLDPSVTSYTSEPFERPHLLHLVSPLLPTPNLHLTISHAHARFGAQQELAASRHKIAGRPPFRSSASSLPAFDAQEHCGVPATLRVDDRCLPPIKDPLESMSPKERAESRRSRFQPFRPPSPGKQGYDGCEEPASNRAAERSETSQSARQVTPAQRGWLR
jgi:hypothetical protein